jgi:hypothetical protein
LSTIAHATGVEGTVPDGDGGTLSLTGFVFTDSVDECAAWALPSYTGGWIPSDTVLAVLAVTPGTPVVGQQYQVSTNAALGFFTHFDASCNPNPPKTPPTPADSATGGFIKFDSISATNLTGSYDITFPSGELKGTFDVQVCASPAKFQCVSNSTNCCG